MLVFASAPLGDRIRWVEKSTNAPIVAERLPADDPQRKNLPKEGELWLLRLPQPTSKPIEIRGGREQRLVEAARVPLLALPEAIEQRGLAFVRGTISGSPSVETGRTPPHALAHDGFQRRSRSKTAAGSSSVPVQPDMIVLIHHAHRTCGSSPPSKVGPLRWRFAT